MKLLERTFNRISENPPEEQQMISNGAMTKDSIKEDLFIAVQQGDEERLRQLLAAGGSPDARNPEGQTLLMVASRENQVQAVNALLDMLADPDLQDPYGNTALMVAAMGGNGLVAEALVKRFADIDLENDEAVDAVDLARRYKRGAMVEMLEDKKLNRAYLKAVQQRKQSQQKKDQDKPSGIVAAMKSELESEAESLSRFMAVPSAVEKPNPECGVQDCEQHAAEADKAGPATMGIAQPLKPVAAPALRPPMPFGYKSKDD